MSWPPKDGSPYMPANGTEGGIFDDGWCSHCARDAAFREDMDHNDGCQILAAALCNQQPKEWIWRNGAPHCIAFRDDPANPARCPYTLEMFE